MEKLEIEKRVKSTNDVYQLNVSGVTEGFMVSKALLTAVPGSQLEAVFSGRQILPKIDGKIFVDRNPKLFREVIEYIRGNMKLPRRVLDDKYLLEEVTEELEHWGLIQSKAEDPQNKENDPMMLPVGNLNPLAEKNSDSGYLKKQIENYKRKLNDKNFPSSEKQNI